MKYQQLIAMLEKAHNHFHSRTISAINRSLVLRNWLFGRYIVEYEQQGDDRAEYGKSILKNLSRELSQTIGRGFSEDNLGLMRKFYLTLPEMFSISETLSRNSLNLSILPMIPEETYNQLVLGWSHYVLLCGINCSEERKFYEIEAINNSWSLRELRRQVNSSLFERLSMSNDKNKIQELSQKGQILNNPQDVVKDPYILEFLELKEETSYSETQLETAIINKLENFLLELGKGFLFEARQKRFSFDESHFYVDLVFYNRLLHCYVLIDLKIDKLTHQDLGQMQMYVNYFDRYVKTDDETPTIGIVLCKEKSDIIVELTLPKDSNIYASKYQLYLPSKEDFIRQIEEVREEVARYG